MKSCFSATPASVEEGFVGGDESWPHLHGEDDGGKKTWRSKDGGPSFEVDWSKELTECGEPSVDIQLSKQDEVRDETNDP